MTQPPEPCILEDRTCPPVCPAQCAQVLAEIERNIDDIKVNGNYTRTTVIDGQFYRQKFRNHQPVGEPELHARMPKPLEDT